MSGKIRTYMQINTSSKIRIFFGKIRTCKKNTHTYKIRKFLVKIRPYIKKYASQIKENTYNCKSFRISNKRIEIHTKYASLRVYMYAKYV